MARRVRPSGRARGVYFGTGVAGALIVVVLSVLFDWSQSFTLVVGVAFVSAYVLVATPMLFWRSSPPVGR